MNENKLSHSKCCALAIEFVCVALTLGILLSPSPFKINWGQEIYWICGETMGAWQMDVNCHSRHGLSTCLRNLDLLETSATLLMHYALGYYCRARL